MKSSSAQRHFFLSCDSSKVIKLTHVTGKNVYSFGMVVDAIFAANIISAQILVSAGKSVMSFFSKLLSRIMQINMNPNSILPMYLGGEEVYTIGYIFFSIFAFLFPLTNKAIGFSVASFVSGALTLASFIYDFVVWVIDFINGRNPNPHRMVYILYKLITGIGAIITAKILSLVWWAQPMAYATLNADTVKNGVATIAVVLLTAAALAGLMYFLTLFTVDFIDANTHYW